MQNKHKPQKKYGQHFLTDDNIIRKIVKEIAPVKDEIIVEIGAGKGALTKELLKSGAKIFAVEIDKVLYLQLKSKFDSIKIFNDDILKLNFSELFTGKKIRIVGNIPYNITSPIFFKLIENREYVQDAVFMIQDEVAKRVVAPPGRKEYGILSVILNYFADVKYCFKISGNVFYPRPKVYSAVIHLKFKDQTFPQEKQFVKVVKAAFNYRRKTLKNSLNNSIFKDCNFEKINFDLSRRPESLTIDDFLILTKEIIENCQ